MDPLDGKTARAPNLTPVSTRLQRIAELAKKAPEMVIHSLSHHIDVAFLREAHDRTRKDGAEGVDEQTAADYAVNLEANLESLLDRLKSGTYKAPPVRRVHIPKGDGSKTRPIGIPTFEDKVLQRAVVMVLNAVYEQDFLDCSYGYRPGRSAHQAVDALRKGLMDMGGGWVLEADIKGFFDNLEHGHLRNLLDLRVRDGVLRRVINKWLKAGVMENGNLSYPESGTPQGGVVSPVLANVYLHEVLDKWFEGVVKPCLKGHAFLIRYADDFVIVFELEADAKKVWDVLPKRFGKFGLTLHPDKTRIVPFVRPPRRPDAEADHETFDLLGFTHYWGSTLKGGWAVKRKTAESRFTRGLKKIDEWCQRHRHLPLTDQCKQLGRKFRGHCQYYGITGNSQALGRFRFELLRYWFKWLKRRSQRARKTWEWFYAQVDRLKFPRARAVHSMLRHAANP
jgi:RNA-directed DNA polymerase